MLNNRLQSGRSMIEMLGVLAIIGVLSIGGIAGYTHAIAKHKINNTIDQLSTLVTNIRSLYSQQTDYSDLDNEQAKNMGIVPQDMIVRAHSKSGEGSAAIVAEHIQHGFKGNVIIKSAGSRAEEIGSSAASRSRTAFIVDFENLPYDACVRIASANWGTATSSGLIGIQVKGEPNYGNDPTDLFIGCQGSYVTMNGVYACPKGKVQSIPLDTVKASQACRCFEGPSCSIVWKYY